jgi:hypothetical protein
MNEQPKKVVTEVKKKEESPPIATILTAFVTFLISATESIVDPTMVSLMMAGIKLAVQAISYFIEIDVVMKKEDVKEDMAGTTLASMFVSGAYELAQVTAPLTHPAVVLIFQSFATELLKVFNRLSTKQIKHNNTRARSKRRR